MGVDRLQTRIVIGIILSEIAMIIVRIGGKGWEWIEGRVYKRRVERKRTIRKRMTDMGIRDTIQPIQALQALEPEVEAKIGHVRGGRLSSKIVPSNYHSRIPSNRISKIIPKHRIVSSNKLSINRPMK